MKQLSNKKLEMRTRYDNRVSEVKRFISTLNIGANDKTNVEYLLTEGVTTQKGLNRSLRIQNLLEGKDLKKLSRFAVFGKELRDSSATFSTAIRLLRNDGEWYRNNKDLIIDYNNFRTKLKTSLDPKWIEKNKELYKQLTNESGVSIKGSYKKVKTNIDRDFIKSLF